MAAVHWIQCRIPLHTDPDRQNRDEHNDVEDGKGCNGHGQEARSYAWPAAPGAPTGGCPLGRQATDELHAVKVHRRVDFEHRGMGWMRTWCAGHEVRWWPIWGARALGAVAVDFGSEGAGCGGIWTEGAGVCEFGTEPGSRWRWVPARWSAATQGRVWSRVGRHQDGLWIILIVDLPI